MQGFESVVIVVVVVVVVVEYLTKVMLFLTFRYHHPPTPRHIPGAWFVRNNGDLAKNIHFQ
jgi:hypothetical protein